MTIPFVRSPNFTKSGIRKIQAIVLHDMEAPEKGDTAEAVARYFQNPAVEAAAHYCVDNDSVVRCVRDHNIAWHARGMNSTSIGVEHAGYARQSKHQWDDDYSHAMLKRSAKLVARLCRKYGIEVRFVDAAGLKAGRRGITTHAEVTKAFRQSTHTDPGPNFPMGAYIGWVQDASLPAVSVRRMVSAKASDAAHPGKAAAPKQTARVQRALGFKHPTGRWGLRTRKAVGAVTRARLEAIGNGHYRVIA